MTKAETLIAELEAHGDETLLDDLIVDLHVEGATETEDCPDIEAFEEEAADVNNGGYDAQVAYLTDALGEDGAAYEIRKLLEDAKKAERA